MTSIEAAPTNEGWDCIVEINAGERDASRHNVRVTHEDLERWGKGGSVEELVRRAFDFLLAKESPQEILKSFELSEIARYFPDFPDAITK